MISLKQIHYALAIERTLHFKKAAEACAVSQSALSTALSEMEKQLGFQIFERNNKQVLVTPLGKQVLEKAHQIKLQVDDLTRLGESQREPLHTRMSLGIIPTICPFLLPVVLPLLQQQYPSLQLQISEEQSHELVDHVRNGELDAAILDPQQLMLLKEGHCLKDHALAVCHLSEIAAHHLSATSLNTLVQLVANGLGTTLVPEIALPQLVDENPRIAKVPLAEPGPHREIAFIVRPNYPSLGNIELLMRLFQHELKRVRGT
ncbi:MAG: LysR family transcriptional regulator [Candidatus Thiodiazotropha sp.]